MVFARRRASFFAALPLLASFAIGGLPSSPPTVVNAAAAPWTTPTSPPRCTQQQANDGTVSGCVLMAGQGLPEDRGWPVAPFPTPENQTVVAWVNLSLGMKDTTIAKVQTALNKAGATLVADGSFGYQTLAAVKAYQTTAGLPVTGVVDKAMADKLAVQRTTGGTFPPKGWVWNGWGYNGSPALDAYSKQLTSNTRQIGAMPPGSLRAFAAALPLYEQFYAEIQAKGYVVRNGGTWVFRCTASTRKDCAGLTKYALSNHAFGLASDINTVQNPMVRYYASGSTSACAVPMKTDMPRWVVQTAEKWGLYWGGYGWTSGCQSPTQWRDSVSRDPMHFEFNGTPQQAQAILRRNLGSGTCIDIVNELGQPINWCLMKGEVPPAGTRLAIRTDAPAGAAAALVRVTTSGATSNTWYTAESCDPRPSGRRSTMSGTASVGRTLVSTVMAPLDSAGRFCVYQGGAFHTTVEVDGFFVPSATHPESLEYTPSTTQRTLATATTPFCGPDGTCWPAGPVAPGQEVANLAASADLPEAVLATVRAGGGTTGSIGAGACGATAATVPGWLTLNPADTVTSRTGVVPATATEAGVLFCTRAGVATQETVDVSGFFVPPGGGGLTLSTVATRRLVNTRGCWLGTDQTTHCVEPLGGSAAAVGTAPAGAAAVAVTLNLLNATGQYDVAAGACDTDPSGWTVWGTSVKSSAYVSAFAIVPVSASGTFCVRATGPVNVLVDLTGVLTAGDDLGFVPVEVRRVYSTRR